MVSAATKRENIEIILAVLDAKGGDGRFLHAIAVRESGLNHAVEHRLKADSSGSLKAWQRNARLFRNNPYYDDSTLWDHGKGLFGMMPANHLQRWDPTASPDVLLNPYVASATAARLVQRCMDVGASTWADVDQCWGTGSPRRRETWDARRRRMRKRLARLGYPPDLVDAPPEPGDWGTKPQPGQEALLWSIHESLSSGASETPEVVGPEEIEVLDRDDTIVLTAQPARRSYLVPVLATAGLGAVGLGIAGLIYARSRT